MNFDKYQEPNGDIRLAAVKEAVANGWDPKEDDSSALRVAISNNDRPAFDYLLPLSDPAANASIALQCAAHYNRSEMLSDLLPHCDANAKDAAALLVAAKRGNAECFEQLVSMCDPRPRREQISQALQHIEDACYTDRMGFSMVSNDVQRFRDSVNARCEQLSLDETLRQAEPVAVDAPRPMKRRL